MKRGVIGGCWSSSWSCALTSTWCAPTVCTTFRRVYCVRARLVPVASVTLLPLQFDEGEIKVSMCLRLCQHVPTPVSFSVCVRAFLHAPLSSITLCACVTTCKPHTHTPIHKHKHTHTPAAGCIPLTCSLPPCHDVSVLRRSQRKPSHLRACCSLLGTYVP